MQGLDLSEYLAHLASGSSSDGLELWIASVAMSRLLNVVLESVVWSTAVDGIEEFPWICLTSYDKGVLCQFQLNAEEVDDLSALGAVAPPLHSKSEQGGNNIQKPTPNPTSMTPSIHCPH